jgi:hypothetical protein
MFFILFSLLIISNYNLAMYKPENTEKFFELFGVWISKVYVNFNDITGNVIKQDWSP